MLESDTKETTETMGFSFQRFITKQDQSMDEYLKATYLEMKKHIMKFSVLRKWFQLVKKYGTLLEMATLD